MFSKWLRTHFKSKYLALIFFHDQIFKRCTTKNRTIYHKVKIMKKISLTKKTLKILMVKFSYKKSGYLTGSNVTNVKKLSQLTDFSFNTKKQCMGWYLTGSNVTSVKKLS